MKAEVVVRPARAEDAERIAAIYLESAALHAGRNSDFHRVPDRGAVERRFRARADEQDKLLLVAEADGSVVGCVATLSHGLPDPSSMIGRIVARVSDVGVAATHRGQGIGSALMSAAEEWAREQGAEMVMVDTDLRNVDAIRFYEKRLGYEERGVLLMKDLS